MRFIVKSPSAARPASPARAARTSIYPAIARIWRSYTAKAGLVTRPSCFLGVFGRCLGLAAHKSGRRARVRASASACRQAATLAWSPEVRISGIGRPSNSCGRVYCGYSSRESEKLSSVAGGQLAHHARQQPDAGVDQRHGGDFAARKHVIADRNLLEPAGLDHPLVDALEPAADDQRPRPGGEFHHPRLGQWPTARAHQQARPVRGDIGGVDGVRQHVGAQHHAGPAAGRGVVDAAVPVGGGGPDVPRLQRPQPGRQRLAREADAERPGNISGNRVRTVARQVIGLRSSITSSVGRRRPRSPAAVRSPRVRRRGRPSARRRW